MITTHKAILLAGGTGTRLHPLTLGINKHLLPVGDRLMIERALLLLARLHIRDVLIVSDLSTLGSYGRLCQLDHEPYNQFDSIYHAVQPSPLGIAQAISLGQTFAGSDNFLVLLADNIFSDQDVPLIRQALHAPHGAHIFTTHTNDPQSVGILRLIDHKPWRCLEKPNEGSLAITGLYLLDHRVWQYISKISPSARGEYEITDVLNHYIEEDALTHSHLKGPWVDLGGSLQQYLDYHHS